MRYLVKDLPLSERVREREKERKKEKIREKSPAPDKSVALPLCYSCYQTNR